MIILSIKKFRVLGEHSTNDTKNLFTLFFRKFIHAAGDDPGLQGFRRVRLSCRTGIRPSHEICGGCSEDFSECENFLLRNVNFAGFDFCDHGSVFITHSTRKIILGHIIINP